MILFTTIENFSDRFKIERLYMCYRNLMYKEALEIVQNPHSAEDAVSESFVRIIKNLHKIDEQNRPKTRSFLVIICRKVAKYAARAAAEYLLDLVNDILTLNKIDTDNAAETDIKSVFSLEEEVRNLTLLTDERAKASGIKLELLSMKTVLKRYKNSSNIKLQYYCRMIWY